MDNIGLELLKEFPYNKLTKYFVCENGITIETNYVIKRIRARELINANRIDLMAKWIYVDAREKGMDMHDAEEIYKAHIEAFSGGLFFEPGSDEKKDINDFFEIFDKLIKEIKEYGFDPEKSLIPVGDNNILLDGAHRCAIAAYFDYEVTVIYFPQMTRNMNYQYFRDWLLYDKFLDRMILQYSHLVSNLYCACIWPRAENAQKREMALKMIADTGIIVYTKEVEFTYCGITNFMIQIYGNQTWIGTYQDGHSGVKAKVDECYKKKIKTLVVFFEADSLECVLELKRNVRNIFNMENHSIHISDTMPETREMAELVLNANSLLHLNYGYPDRYSEATQKLLDTREQIIENGEEIADCIFDSNGTLMIWGIAKKNSMVCLRNMPIDLIYNPNNYFVYMGMKFIALDKVYKMEENGDIKGIRKAYKAMKKELKRVHREYKKNAHKRYMRVHGKMSFKGVIYHMWIFFLKRTGLIKNTRWNV